MIGLCVNISQFEHPLVMVDFDCTINHFVLNYIMKNKTEQASPRIKRLLKPLRAYPFNLYYMKGKDKIQSKFLSRIEVDKSNPNKTLQFHLICKKYYKKHYYIHIKHEAEKTRIAVGKVHVHDKPFSIM